MNSKIKNTIVVLMILVFAFALFFFSDVYDPEAIKNTELAKYYLENAYIQTGASNIVTAIYLNYRVYDTLFEALMLFVGVAAIIYFSRHGGDLEND